MMENVSDFRHGKPYSSRSNGTYTEERSAHLRS
jgi:hypothetical protein